MLIIGNLEISWFAVFTAVACFIGVCIACLLRFVQRKDINDIFTCVAFGIPLGLVFGRILYIIFSGSGLTGLGQYLNLTNGGFGLYGVFFGVFLGALIAVRYFYADGLGSLLDCLSIGGAFAITVGRFATGFTPAEIGYEVDFKLFAVFDKEQGIYNLAVYQLDGLYEAIVFCICLWFFIHCKRNGDKNTIYGKTALLMLALHGTNQVVMDSMRADPLKLGLNEFIKISQIIGIVCCVAVLVTLIILTAKRYGFSKFHWVSLPLIVVSIILGVFGEYRVGSSNYISNHLIMFAGMVILDWLTIEYALKSAGFNEEFSREALKETAPLADNDALDDETPEDENEAQAISSPAKKQDEDSVTSPKNDATAIESEKSSPVSKDNSNKNLSYVQPSVSTAKSETKYAKLKTIPVVSVDAQPIRQEATKTDTAPKTASVQPAKNPAAQNPPKDVSVLTSQKPAADQTHVETANKPLGEQELNMEKIILELDKIDS